MNHLESKPEPVEVIDPTDTDTCDKSGEERMNKIREAAACFMLKCSGECKVIPENYPTPPINDFI